MQISIVVAVAENNVIGVDNQLPWHLPEDLKFFKRTTMGKPVLMGKNTWLSIGKALPGRLNIVVSSSLSADLPEGVVRVVTLQDAFALLNGKGAEEVCIIGGGKLYESTLAITDIIYRTVVHTIIENGTAFFPEIKEEEWNLVGQERHDADEKHAFNYTFERWERKKA